MSRIGKIVIAVGLLSAGVTPASASDSGRSSFDPNKLDPVNLPDRIIYYVSPDQIIISPGPTDTNQGPPSNVLVLGSTFVGLRAALLQSGLDDVAATIQAQALERTLQGLVQRGALQFGAEADGTATLFFGTTPLAEGGLVVSATGETATMTLTLGDLFFAQGAGVITAEEAITLGQIVGEGVLIAL